MNYILIFKKTNKKIQERHKKEIWSHPELGAQFCVAGQLWGILGPTTGHYQAVLCTCVGTGSSGGKLGAAFSTRSLNLCFQGTIFIPERKFIYLWVKG